MNFACKLTAVSLLAGAACAWAVTPSAAQLIPSRAAVVGGENTGIVEQVQQRRQARRAGRQIQMRARNRPAARQLRREARPRGRPERRVERRIERRQARRADRRVDRRRALRVERRADRHRFRHRHVRRFHDRDRVFFGFGLAAPFVAAPVVTAPVVTAPVVGGCGSSVVVQPGDTLAIIAAGCGTTVSALLAANPQIYNPNIIHVGEVVRMPWA